MLAFIGGTGFYKIGKKLKDHRVKTKFGTVNVQEIRLLKKRALFIPRYGIKHELPPHKVNYRANAAALESIGASGVLSVHTAGSMSKYYRPGDLVLLEDFISLWMPNTLYDDFSGGIKQVDFSEPFDEEMKGVLRETAAVKGIRLKEGGVIATTPGPRFETKAEVRALWTMGANLVDLSCGRESALFGEAEVPHASIAMVTNYACGVSDRRIGEAEVAKHVDKKKEDVLALLEGLVEKSR